MIHRRRALTRHPWLPHSCLGSRYLRVVRTFASDVHDGKNWGVVDLYKRRVADGHSHYDETQYKLVQHLGKLQQLLTSAHLADPAAKKPRGAYLCGSVGIGKTMIMDLFFDSCSLESKRRVHFHQFMLEVHRRVHERKKELIELYGRDRHINLSSERDAISYVAKDISAQSKLLCFDEFHVTDIADAMIMSRLFGELWRNETVLVATSNRHPDHLYENGLNRSYFLPFIETLKMQCATIELNTSKDYRLEAIFEEGSYFVPLTDASRKHLYDSFLRIGASEPGPVSCASLVEVPVMMGRRVPVEGFGRCCYVSFRTLCDEDRGPADYHAICSQYDSIFLDGVRQLSLKEHNIVRRFIMLIDVIYDSGCRFVWSGEAEPKKLFKDMFVEGLSTLRIVIESDDLSPFDPEVEQLSAAQSRPTGQIQHIQHHSTSRPRENVKCVQSDHANNADTFSVMKGEMASFRDLDFAVRRAVSRLVEMSGKPYINAGRKNRQT